MPKYKPQKQHRQGSSMVSHHWVVAYTVYLSTCVPPTPMTAFPPSFFCGSSLLSRIQPALYTNSHEITLPCGELHMCACRKWKEKRERKEKIKIQDGCSVVPFHPAAAATACNVESPVRFGQDWMSQPIHISYILPSVQKTSSSDILDSFRFSYCSPSCPRCTTALVLRTLLARVAVPAAIHVAVPAAIRVPSSSSSSLLKCPPGTIFFSHRTTGVRQASFLVDT